MAVSNVVLSKPTAIAAGWHHSLALDDTGNLYGWGWNDYLQTTPPALREGGTRFTTMAGGATHSLALDDTGNLYAWGWDEEGVTDTPALRDNGTRFTTIAAGGYHSLALDDTGNLYGWGWNESGQTRPPALRDGGTTFTAIAAGGYHSLALDDKGNLYGWGYNFERQATPPGLRDGGTTFTAIAAGTEHSLALDDKGNLYGWGNNGERQATPPALRSGGTTFTAIAVGGYHSLALDDKGNLYVWGNNDYHQAFVPASLSPVYARSMPIAMGGLNAYGIEDTGALSSFAGPNWTFDNSNYISVAAGPRHGLALTRSGTVEGWGDFEVGQLDIPSGLSGVVQVAAGYAYSAALRSDGTVVEWGAHTAPSGNLITKPDDLPRLRQLAGGLTHILGITVDGKVVGWGDNTSNKATPPDGLDKVVAAAANGSCSVALRDNGDLVYWGSCPASFSATRSLPGATAIAMSDVTVAAISNGQIITWGEDAPDLLAAPAGINYVAISGGTAAFLAVTRDGTVVSWGSNYGEPITIPESFGGPAPIVNDGICEDCDVAPQEFVLTDEMVADNAAFYTSRLSPAQRTQFIEALGGSVAKPLTPAEIQALVDAATAAERENARKTLEAALASRAPAAATVLPAAKSPLTKIGARVNTRRAVTMLGLKRVTRVSFVKPKETNTTCAVTARTVTAKSAGTCNVKVRYTDSKKKVRTTTLTLSIG